MVNLNVNIVGYNPALQNITINDNFCKIKKNKDRTRTIQTQVEDGKVEITVLKYHHYSGKYWVWWNLLCFFVSVFGIFDVKPDKKFVVVEYKSIVDVKTDSNITLKIQRFEDGGKFLELETENEVEEISNKQYYDRDARKKHKKMNKIKVGAFVACVAIVAILVFVL